MKAAVKVGKYDIAALRVASNDSIGRYGEGNCAGFSWVKEAQLKRLTSAGSVCFGSKMRRTGGFHAMSALLLIPEVRMHF
jgi:hypothetical protein